MPRALVVKECRSLCAWRASRAGVGLFACTGCGSQWEPGQAWTPVDADGRVPDEVLAARRP